MHDGTHRSESPGKSEKNDSFVPEKMIAVFKHPMTIFPHSECNLGNIMTGFVFKHKHLKERIERSEQ
jgi:hypothetical protein